MKFTTADGAMSRFVSLGENVEASRGPVAHFGRCRGVGWGQAGRRVGRAVVAAAAVRVAVQVGPEGTGKNTTLPS